MKFIALPIFKRGTPLSPFERFQRVLFLFVLGHGLNYVVLRNLYIPHRYYVIPLYTIFCLALTVLVADLRTLLLRPMAIKTRLWARLTSRFTRLRAVDRLRESSACVISVCLAALAAVFLAAALTFDTNQSWQGTFLTTARMFGNRTLAIELLATLAGAVKLFYGLAVALGGLAVLTAILPFSKLATNGPAAAALERTGARFEQYGITATGPLIGLFFVLLIAFSVMKTCRSLDRWAGRYREHIDTAEALARIREDTTPGDLVLCWKWCIAFYADKRSITDATVNDLPYYREHNIHSVMGPVKPLNHFYKRIAKYAEPMSYWRPLSKDEVKNRRIQQKKKRQKKDLEK